MAQDFSFDAVSEVDLNLVNESIQVAMKEIANRFDFKNANASIELDAKATLALSPSSALALRFANSFGVYVRDLLKEGFPNMRIVTAPQYGQQTTTNTQGYSTAGNAVQLILNDIQGQKVANAAFNEKLRAHKIIPEPSAWQQKYTSGTWGTILRMPLGVTGMLGI